MSQNHTLLSQLVEPIELDGVDPRLPLTFGLTHHVLCQVETIPDGIRVLQSLLPGAPFPRGLSGPALIIDLNPVLYGTYLPLEGALRERWGADALLLEFRIVAADPEAVALAIARGQDPLGTLIAAAGEVLADLEPDQAEPALAERLAAMATGEHLRLTDLVLRREWLATAAESAPDFRDDVLAPIPPQIPEPATAGAEPDQETPVRLRLDAAAPKTVFVERAFTLAVAISAIDAPPPVEAGLDRAGSAPILLTWPEDTPSVMLRVNVTAPDCRFDDGDERAFRLFHGQEAPRLYFQLIPLRADDLNLVITVFQAEETLGAARLVTRCEPGPLRHAPAGAVELAVTSLPLEPRPPADWPRERVVAFRDALSATFDVDELQDLCFRMGIEYEDLAAETKSGKARELVEYTLRHGRFTELVEICRGLRPRVFP